MRLAKIDLADVFTLDLHALCGHFCNTAMHLAGDQLQACIIYKIYPYRAK